MTPKSRTRVTIEAVPLVIQPDDAEIATFAPPGSGELVRPLPVTATDSVDGIRRFEVVVDGWLFEVATEPAVRAELRDRVARSAAEHHATARMTLRAQIPGRIVRLWVAEGETVERGQRLLAIEAMKMENEIRAPQRGIVEDVRVQMGDRVERGDEMLSIG